jgi:hypothetical protein
VTEISIKSLEQYGSNQYAHPTKASIANDTCGRHAPHIERHTSAHGRRCSTCHHPFEEPTSGELRNRIYEYTPATRNGLEFIAEPKPHFALYFSSKKPNVELNQVKYTYRQLYEETAGLEVQVNQVHFIGRHSDSWPAKLFLEFIATCAPEKAYWFRDLILTFETNVWGYTLDAMLEQQDAILSLDNFCRKHPLVHVHYIPDDVELASTGGKRFLMMMGMFLNHVFRGKSLGSMPTDIQREVLSQIKVTDWYRDAGSAVAIGLPRIQFQCPIESAGARFLLEFVNNSPWSNVQACLDLAKDWGSNSIYKILTSPCHVIEGHTHCTRGVGDWFGNECGGSCAIHYEECKAKIKGRRLHL